jgi:glycosyltransferase involved in cell wall biosynthesis
MTKLSAVIITKNEERNIERCLQSLQGVADEIVVVDSGSTDRTEEICKQFQVKFIKQDWLGFGAQKNLGADHTTHDYILSIDADEVLSETLKKSILSAKNQGFPATGYSMNILANYCGHWVKHCGWYPGRKNRIYNKIEVKWNNASIHERLDFQPTHKIEFLKGDLLHYSFHTLKDYQNKTDRYTQLLIETRILQGKSPNIVRAICSACVGFLKIYFFQLGFLDGSAGFAIARSSAIWKYNKYRMKQSKK